MLVRGLVRTPVLHYMPTLHPPSILVFLSLPSMPPLPSTSSFPFFNRLFLPSTPFLPPPPPLYLCLVSTSLLDSFPLPLPSYSLLPLSPISLYPFPLSLSPPSLPPSLPSSFPPSPPSLPPSLTTSCLYLHFINLSHHLPCLRILSPPSFPNLSLPLSSLLPPTLPPSLPLLHSLPLRPPSPFPCPSLLRVSGRARPPHPEQWDGGVWGKSPEDRAVNRRPDQ